MSARTAGRLPSRFAKLFEENRDELLTLARSDTRLWRQTIVALRRMLPIIQSFDGARPKVFDKELAKNVDEVLGRLGEEGSPKLRQAMKSMRKDLQPFAGRTIKDGIKAADKSQRRK